MGRKAEEKSPLAVSRLQTGGYHAVGGVDGLYLQLSDTGRVDKHGATIFAKSWILRTTIGTGRPELGLGPYPEIGVADARLKAAELKEQIRRGVDPRESRRQAREQLKAEEATNITLRDFAEKYIEAQEASWKGDKSRKQWTGSLRKHVYPHIGDMYLKHIELRHILQVLEPIWKTTTETATRIRGRLEAILASAIVKRLRPPHNPAVWKNYLETILPAPESIAPTQHHPALPFESLSDFMADLRQREGSGARCLEFLVLTAVRSAAARGAMWDEIDLTKRIWTIPKERNKGTNEDAKELRVPLSNAALKLIKAQPRIQDCDLVFPSPQENGVLSDATLGAVMERMGISNEVAVPHGFRSTFKDWAIEETEYPGEMSELALGHKVGDKVERAYRRRDMFEKRRRQMNDWASFCETKYVHKNHEGAEIFDIASKVA